jgi:MFS family permease
MASHTTAAEQQPAPFNPTAVIVCGCLIAMIAFGVRSTMGLFNGPITEANGWGRETFGLAMALQNLIWGAAQPFAGAFADKFGSYRVIIAGAAIYAAGTAMMVISDTGPMMYLAGGLLMGLGIAMTSFSIIMAAFGRLVPPEKRSWSFGIATAASSMGPVRVCPTGTGLHRCLRLAECAAAAGRHHRVHVAAGAAAARGKGWRRT